MMLMAHLKHAESAHERRGSPRRESGATLSVGIGSTGALVMVLNLSQTGLRLRSQAPCAVGGVIHVEIPGYPSIGAKVVWRDGDQFGCEFDQPLCRGAMSAFTLRSQVARGPSDWHEDSTEICLGKNSEDIAAWVSNLELQQDGRILSGFRDDKNGDIIAILAEPS